MTMPQGPSPEELRKAPSLFRAGVHGLKDNASRLGLTWNMHLGTVVSYDDGTGTAFVILDGDTQPVAAKSMIGAVVNAQRIYVQQVPPTGYFICGFLGTSNSGYSARQILTATSASVTFSKIPTNLRKLRWSFFAKADNAVTVQLMFLRINLDSSAAYFYEYGQAQNNAIAPTALGATSQAQGVCGLCTGSSTFFFAGGQGELQSWDNLGGVGDIGWTYVTHGLGSSVATFTANAGGGLYNGAPPYTSLTFFPQAGNFIAGSDFQIEGPFS